MNGMNTLDEVISQKGITMQVEKVSTNPIHITKGLDEDIEHYRCRLAQGSEALDVYMSVHAQDGSPSLSDVFFLLAVDACGCRMLAGYEDDFRGEKAMIFAGSDGNMQEMEDFWQEYSGRCRQTEKLKQFLGESLYNDILRRFDMGEAMPGIF